MSDIQVALLAAMLVPIVLIILVGMIKNYHIWVHIYKPHKKEDCEEHKHG